MAKEKKISDLEVKMRLFCDWLKTHREYVDPYCDGTMESAIKHCREETIQQIGYYLEEILDMSPNRANTEFEKLKNG